MFPFSMSLLKLTLPYVPYVHAQGMKLFFPIFFLNFYFSEVYGWGGPPLTCLRYEIVSGGHFGEERVIFWPFMPFMAFSSTFFSNFHFSEVYGCSPSWCACVVQYMLQYCYSFSLSDVYLELIYVCVM